MVAGGASYGGYLSAIPLVREHSFKALQSNGVESRLAYYPDENHWVLTRENSVHGYGEFRDWITHFAAPGPQ